MLKYICPLIVVNDIAVSRHFYEGILGLKVKYDLGQNVTFDGDFAIHLKSHFQTLLGDEKKYPVADGSHQNSGELYFEDDEIEAVYRNLEQAGVEFIHAIREQPWCQRVIRLYDPDGHIIEIGESMEAVVRRLHAQGLSVEAISARTFMPPDFVRQVVGE